MKAGLTGIVHGRFQPFHIGHFSYLSEALSLYSSVVIGITNPDTSSLHQVASDDHRHLPEANPFTYFWRSRMIQLSVAACPKLSSRLRDITTVPFRIHEPPDDWRSYFPHSGGEHIMRVLDEWDREKAEKFKKAGYQVRLLSGTRECSGTEVRKDIFAGGSRWRTLVPEGTAAVLGKWLEQHDETFPRRESL
ncbi:adenylyltransferase/cytidyltransferase family protein [Aurantimonas sp. VKM B-3413]|uniref:adenylyltransferase/cytidyltransferase family protein n=1 Tax=Aurantimonas sp. VKM B-3413 TaxID=2779401 RepID=UPI001E5FE626|nr:adenylyltransferase/cytidyltransferase family protein [Aurantimonas sp. VKM B-3413]MCB8836121.1 adenylyltransferase/cytidyltransferase family protein [Aurantimonas sp. VKM B-3413]